MEEIRIEVTLKTTEVDVIEKARLYLEHYRNTELSNELESLHLKLMKAMLSTLKITG